MPPRALVIEDNPSNRHLATFLLKRAGYTVEVAGDGAEGIRQATTNPPDLVIMDLELPVLDGFEAIARLKSDARTRAIPILVASSYALETERRRALDLGADAYLDKPFDLTEFAETATRLCPVPPPLTSSTPSP